MAFKLPKLTTDIDCADIGYPGLVVTCLLNPTYTDYQFPWASVEDEAEREKRRRAIIEREPWQAELYYLYSRTLERITFPPEMTDHGQAEVIELSDGQAVWQLMTTPGFEQNIIVWADTQRQAQRQARLEAELKN